MTNKIAELDKNFQIEAAIHKEGMAFYSADSWPFSIHGVFKEDGKYRRIPEAVAKTVSQGVHFLNNNTAGGRVRFRTNSTRVAIITKTPGVGRMSIFTLAGSSGFDLYVNNEYAGTFIPPYDMTDGYESCISVGAGEWRDIVINFPLYDEVSSLHIGIDEDAALEAPAPYALEKPVVYYGSSITQGGCASRPGTAYQAFVSRRFNCDYINLGFSGHAMAEDTIVDYIKGLDMAVFVYDYDHNAPTTEHLKNTHEKMFRAIREAHPLLPIVMMSRPKYTLTPEEEERLAIIKTTYENALAAGDRHVYLIDGKTLMALAGNDGTVDNCHPTDLGFASMAAAVCDVMRKILEDGE